MRSQEHRQTRLDDIKIEDDKTIDYWENISKTFHGGIADMKKRGRLDKHWCQGNKMIVMNVVWLIFMSVTLN